MFGKRGQVSWVWVGQQRVLPSECVTVTSSLWFFHVFFCERISTSLADYAPRIDCGPTLSQRVLLRNPLWLSKARFTKGFSKEDALCTRCGKDGHDAADCVLSWQQAQKSKKENAHKFKPEMSYMALPCTNCGDPNCEGWVYEDSTDDEIFFDQDGADDEE